MAERNRLRRKSVALCLNNNPIPQRYIAVMMGFLGLVNAYLMRQCLSVTITQLVIPRNYTDEQITSQAVCEAKEDIYSSMENTGTRDWSQKLQALTLSSFYIGYLISHIPGGLYAFMYGSKFVLVLGILSTAIFTLLTPWVTEISGAYGLITLRILMGLSQGPIFPALSVLMVDWIPSNERGVLGSFIFGGGQMGSVFSNSITGWMLFYYERNVVFYVWGTIGGLWCIFFVILCYDSPLEHPCIQDEEKQYLLEEIGDASVKRKNLPPVPFKSILTSIPTWSLISAQIGHDWAFYIIIIYLPKYINDVLQIRIDENGFFSSLPSFFMWICSIISGIIADFLIKNELMRITNVRKMMTGIAAFGPAIFLMFASYADCNFTAAITHVCIGMGLMGAYYGGMKLTPIDMSPNYAGVVMAITNGIGACIGFIAPTSVGFMTTDTSLQEWRHVFWFAFSLLCLTGMIYICLANSEIQPWNEPVYKENFLS